MPPVNEAAANTEGDGSHQHDEHTGSAPSAQSSSTTLPQATDEKWTYEKQLQVRCPRGFANLRLTRLRWSRAA